MGLPEIRQLIKLVASIITTLQVYALIINHYDLFHSTLENHAHNIKRWKQLDIEDDESGLKEAKDRDANRKNSWTKSLYIKEKIKR